MTQAYAKEKKMRTKKVASFEKSVVTYGNLVTFCNLW